MSAGTRLRAAPAVRAESLLLAVGVAGVLIGLVVGALMLPGTAPLAGDGSIGQAAAAGAAGISSVVAVVVLWWYAPLAQPWMRKRWWRRAVSAVGLSLVFALLAFFLTSAVFTVFQQAFTGVALDRFAGTFWVGATSGLAAYVTAASTVRITGRSLALVLSVFLVVGVLAFALYAPDPYWWEQFFSVLGTGTDPAGTTFNLTLLLAGIALVTVADFVAHDLALWAAAAGEPPWKVRVVHATLSAMGVLVALVALIPMNLSRFWHDLAAQGLVVVFGLALIAFPVLLRRLPGGLAAFTGAAFGLLVMLVVLFEGVGYLGTTAFEMGAAVTVYGWLLLLIRTASAAAEGALEDAWHDGSHDSDA